MGLIVFLEICFPSRCKKNKFTNYNFCKNHYPPVSEDATSTIINYKWKQNGSIFDFNIQSTKDFCDFIAFQLNSTLLFLKILLIYIHFSEFLHHIFDY